MDISGENALKAIRLVSTFGPAEEEFSVHYRTHEYVGGEEKWREVEGHYVCYLDCSDTFFWGTSDAEEITPANIHILEEVIAELKPRYLDAQKRARGEEGKARSAELAAAHKAFIDGGGQQSDWGKQPEYKEIQARAIYPHRFAPVGDLFAARVRGERPQGAAYKVRYDESIWHLFNEVGPEREVGIGNPKNIGE